MATPKTVLSVPAYPPTSTDGLTPEVAPYAISGITAEPSLAREITGWQAGVIPPAAQENWFRQLMWAINARNTCVAAFTMRATVQISFSGSLTAGDLLRLSYDGHNNDYIVTPADVTGGTPLVAENWAIQLTEDAAIRGSLDFSNLTVFGAGLLQVHYRLAGTQFPHAVTVTHTGTAIPTAADLYGGSGYPLLVTTAPGGGNGLLLSHAGSAQFGTSSTATGINSFAAGGSCDASGDLAIALGDTTTASGSAALAAGSNTTAAGNQATALGLYSSAPKSSSLAMGVESLTTAPGGLAQSSGKFYAVGDAQREDVVVRRSIIDLGHDTLDPGDASAISLNLPNNSHYKVRVDVVALYKSGADGAAGDRATWTCDVAVYTDGAGTATIDMVRSVDSAGAPVITGSGTYHTPDSSVGALDSAKIWFDTVPNGLRLRAGNNPGGGGTYDLTAQFVATLAYTRTHL